MISNINLNFIKMKTNNIKVLYIFFFLATLPFTTLSQYDSVFQFNQIFNINPDSSSCTYQENSDVLTYESFKWGNDFAGLTPADILYIESYNKIFVYGSTSIAVIDPATLAINALIPISNYGQFNQEEALITGGGNRMAYDGNHYLYCFSYCNKIHKIDLNSNEIANTSNLSQLEEDEHLDRIMLKYGRNALILVISSPGVNSKCFKFNPQNLLYIYQSINEKILDFEIHETMDRIFVSSFEPINNTFQYIFSVFTFGWIRDATVDPFYSDTEYKCIEYIYDINNDIHEAICFPSWYGSGAKHAALVYEGDNFRSSTFELKNWHSEILATTYYSIDHLVYFGYSYPNYDGFGTLDVVNDIVSDYVYSSTTSVNKTTDINLSDSKVVIAKVNSLVFGNKTNPNNWTSYEYTHDIIVKSVTATSNIFAINHDDCSLEKFDLAGNHLSNINLGGATLKGIYNQNNNKVFMYSPVMADEVQQLYIADLANTTQDILQFSNQGYGYISSLVNDEPRNNIYISIPSNPLINQNEIIVLDAETNSVQSTGFILPANTCCRSMYLVNDKLYCLLELYQPETLKYSRIYIIDLEQPSNNFTLIPPQSELSGQIVAYFDHFDNGDVLMAINDKANPSNGRLCHISNETNSVIQTYAIIDPYYFDLDENSGKVFFTKFSASAELGIVNLDPPQVYYHDYSDHVLRFLYPVIDNFRNEICVLGHSSGTVYDPIDTKVIWIDPNSLDVTNSIIKDPMAISFRLNHYNGETYVFFPRGSQNRQYIGLIPRGSIDIEMHQLTNGERPIGTSWYSANMPFFDNDYEYLFVPNNFFSNFYKIELKPDHVRLLPNITNWVSFPRLNREGDNPYPAQDLLLNTTPFPTYLKMTNIPPENIDEVTIEYIAPDFWGGALQEVFSTRGYKVTTDNIQASYIPMEGIRCFNSACSNTRVGNKCAYFSRVIICIQVDKNRCVIHSFRIIKILRERLFCIIC